MFTLATLQLFDGLLRNTTLNVGADDFDEAANAVLAARKELAAAIAAHPDSQESKPAKAKKAVKHNGRVTTAT